LTSTRRSALAFDDYAGEAYIEPWEIVAGIAELLEPFLGGGALF